MEFIKEIRMNLHPDEKEIFETALNALEDFITEVEREGIKTINGYDKDDIRFIIRVLDNLLDDDAIIK